jgi:hypothetical protein
MVVVGPTGSSNKIISGHRESKSRVARKKPSHHAHLICSLPGTATYSMCFRRPRVAWNRCIAYNKRVFFWVGRWCEIQLFTGSSLLVAYSTLPTAAAARCMEFDCTRQQMPVSSTTSYLQEIFDFCFHGKNATFYTVPISFLLLVRSRQWEELTIKPFGHVS